MTIPLRRIAPLALLLALSPVLSASAVDVVVPRVASNHGIDSPAALAPSAVMALPAPSLSADVPPAAAAEAPSRADGDARAFDGGGESFAKLLDESRKTDAAAGAGDVDVLAAERPQFSAQQVHRVQELDQMLTAAVREAAAAVFGDKMPTETISRGSTSRGTYVSSAPDYDISVKLPASSPVQFNAFLGSHSYAFKVALQRSASRAAAQLFPGQRVNVLPIDGPIPLTDAATHHASEGIALFHLNVETGSGERVKADVTLVNSPTYASPYPQYFADQIKQVEARDGEAAAERVLDDIRLAKRLFKDMDAYKFYKGGPTAVGIEQMVMQSGRVSDSDRGRTVLETGSFDRMMERLAGAAYDRDGSLRSFDEFQAAWTVHNAFMKPENFLSLMERSWKRVAATAKASQEAKLSGHPVTFDDLRSMRQRYGGRPYDSSLGGLSRRDRRRKIEGARRSDRKDEVKGTEAPVVPVPQADAAAPGALTLGMLERFATNGPRPEERGAEYLYAQGAKVLPPGLEAAWAARIARPLPSGPGISVARVLLMRRQGRTYVMMPSAGPKEKASIRQMDVDDALVQGIVSDTLVDLAYDRGGTRGVRPVGAYPQDMMIGSVVRRGRELFLEGLFHENGRTSSLYAPLKLKDGVAVGDGRIAQAFVRPTASGYEAVPLIDLGAAITPEIAVREIALRRGARGYFDEDVVRQAEAAGRAEDPAGDYARIKRDLEARGGQEHAEDLRSLPFVTIDPPGAGDLDDAYHIEKNADGSYTWMLATADVANYVRPGTTAFRAAARIGNTFYSIDKDGVGEYPMNHPVISKRLASLIAGKDSLAMITRMRFDADGKFLLDKSEVFLGLVHVKGRYTYEQVAELWKGGAGHGVSHVDQVSLARELSDKLARLDVSRGKLNLSLDEVEHVKRGGIWSTRKSVEDPLLTESHRLIEELKVYGNRVIATRLNRISRESGIPHVSRVHPAPVEAATERLQLALSEIGVPWKEGTVSEYLDDLQTRQDVSLEKKQVAQWLVLTSRRSASYAADDAQGHEGLALEAGSYDHPSAPIRRFSDMNNRALLEASLEGSDPKVVHAAIIKDIQSMGFEGLEDYLRHLNGREQAARQMGYEIDEFMSLVELGKRNAGKTFRGHVRLVFQGRNPSATIQLDDSAATIVLRGSEARGLKLLDRVSVTIRGVDLAARRLDAAIVRR